METVRKCLQTGADVVILQSVGLESLLGMPALETSHSLVGSAPRGSLGPLLISGRSEGSCSSRRSERSDHSAWKESQDLSGSLLDLFGFGAKPWT